MFDPASPDPASPHDPAASTWRGIAHRRPTVPHGSERTGASCRNALCYAAGLEPGGSCMRPTWHHPHGLALLALLVVAACDDKQQPPLADPNAPPSIRLSDAGVRYDADRPRPPDGGPAHDDGGGPDAPDAEPPDMAPVDAAAFEQVPFAVETRVGDRRTPVGLEDRVTCEVLDQQGAPIPGIVTAVEIHPDTGFERTERGVIGLVARDYRLVCISPGLGLRDETPAIWTVVPGPAARVTTRVSVEDVDAGGDTETTCAAYDEQGNLVPTQSGDFGVRLNPPAPNLRRRGGETGTILTLIDSGTYAVQCTLPGAEPGPGVTVQVRPGPPANLGIALFPDRPVYPVGSVIELIPVVTDAFGNPIPDAPLTFESNPPLPTFGAGRVFAAQEGRYLLAVNVDGPTYENRALSAAVEILVDFGGPGITCLSPALGEYVVRPAGGMLPLEGKVADIAGVASLTVDGVPVNLAGDGNWRAEVPVEWGLNVHEIVASDGVTENSTFCAYYAADAYLPEDRFLDDALILRLGQGAIDDGEPDAPLQSLADVLRRVVNSAGLRDTAHQAALAQNPIVPNECRARVLGVCLFRLGVEYRDLQLGGRNTIDLTVVEGGLRARATLRNLNVYAQLQGTLGNRVRIGTDHITIDLTFDVGLRNDGNPSVSLRSLNEVDVGHLDSDFSGFITGAILELVFSAFEGLIRRTVVDALRDALQDNIDQALTDLLSNVDVGSLAQGIDVPSLTGGEPVPLTLTVGLSRLDFGMGRAAVGVKARVDGPTRVAGRSPGVPLPTGTGYVELPADRTVGGAVMLAVVDQVLHRLWRAGYFDAEAGGLVQTVAGDLPEGTEVFLRIPTPPAVTGVDGEATVRVFLGPLTAGVVYPGLFVEPFRVLLAAEVDATVTLRNERDLSFEGVEVVALHLALPAVDVPERARQVLEDTLRRVVQAIVDRALNDGLPTLPLPEFVIPDSLGQYDLPVGAGLGLRQPRLTGTTATWRLDGNFGQ